MGVGSCSVLEVQLEDDLSTLRHRLSWLDRGRVAVVLPWDARVLSRDLDFEVLRRDAERQQLEVAVVSPDPERRRLARAAGFPTFGRVEDAQAADVWHGRAREETKAPPRYWWQEAVPLRPRPVRPHAPWFDWVKLGARVVIFLLALLILGGSAYVIAPSAAVTLVPAGREFSTIVAVSVDPEIETVDHELGLIPARRVGVELDGYAEIETTGTMEIVSGRAVGEVLFTNLLLQDFVVPAGTIVRTSSSSYPIRFRTTADVAVPAGGQASVPIEALDERVGNVGAFQINQVEGVAGSAVRVINPSQTMGAEPTDVRVVTQVDYDRLRQKLMTQLLDEVYDEMGELLEPTEILLRESLRVEAVPKQSYTRFVSEQADTVGLELGVLVSGLAVDVDNAENVAYVSLSRQIPPEYELVDARFELGEVAEDDIGPGSFTFFVTAHGYAAAALDANAAVSLVRGRPLAETQDLLQAEYRLAEPPQVEVWPEWLGRMPLLPLRIGVEVVPQDQHAG